jgi:two-component system, NtrC family, response regulator AtoC
LVDHTTPRDETSLIESAPAASRLSLLVLGEHHIATHPLPLKGEIAIGRSPRADILIDDGSISRNHATLAIGQALTIRDDGSANGTWVGGRRIGRGERVELAAGEPVLVGSVTIIVQRRPAPIRPRRLWTHDYFEVRLDEECARAHRNTGTFAVMRVRCEKPAAVQEALTELARLADVVGEYGPGEYEVLLVDASPTSAEKAVLRFVEGLARRGLTIDVGLACFPHDGTTPDELMQHAGRFGRAETASEPRADSSVIISDRAMQELYRLASRVAVGNISVLILGETGVGKEVLAAHVHRSSPRGAKPYLKLNCSALTETLLESELFGHERGAFTGAIKDKPGLLETADGGTVFLDEIGELPLATQVKLLRVIEERVVLRVGGLEPRPIDVRFVAATNRDLEAEIARGNFRQDLFYRLNGALLVIPPLRERPGEIVALADVFTLLAAKQAGLARPPTVTHEALDALQRYAWPGNIRELRNVMERAVLLCGGSAITPAHLPIEKMRVTFAGLASPPEPAPPDEPPPVEREVTMADLRGPGERAEKQRIVAALQQSMGNQKKAAEILGIARRTLINKLERYGIARPRKRKKP